MSFSYLSISFPMSRGWGGGRVGGCPWNKVTSPSAKNPHKRRSTQRIKVRLIIVDSKEPHNREVIDDSHTFHMDVGIIIGLVSKVVHSGIITFK